MTSAGAANQADFAAALLDPALACPPGLHAWNGSDAGARLAVHRNNVICSLVDALAETFPVVQELVGVEFFRAMAAVFVRQFPPRSRVLAAYGQEFPGFVEQFEPARSEPYLADMARLEMARVRAYHAADAAPIASEHVRLALASGERVAELCVFCHPSVSVVSSRYAVVSLWAAHQDGSDLDAIDLDHPEDAIVLRAALDVLVLRLPSGAAAFVNSLRLGGSLGAAAGAAVMAAPGFDLAATFGLLVKHGALISIHLPGRQLS
jgi:hypothetical protein